MIGDEDRWEILESIGAYAAAELSVEETQKTERLVLEDTETQRLADSYARMLALLSAVGKESPEVPEAMIDHPIWRTAEEHHADPARRQESAIDTTRMIDTTRKAGRQGGPD